MGRSLRDDLVSSSTILFAVHCDTNAEPDSTNKSLHFFDSWALINSRSIDALDIHYHVPPHILSKNDWHICADIAKAVLDDVTTYLGMQSVINH